MTTLKLTGMDGQAGRQTGGQTDRQDHVLSQADALTKKTKMKNGLYVMKRILYDMGPLTFVRWPL